MLLKILKYCDLNERMLMDVYAESNFENTDYFFPDEENKELAVQKVEAAFIVGMTKTDGRSDRGTVSWNTAQPCPSSTALRPGDQGYLRSAQEPGDTRLPLRKKAWT